jgi:hypothetical protein
MTTGQGEALSYVGAGQSNVAAVPPGLPDNRPR